MSDLAFKGDPDRVIWSEFAEDDCSYCGATIPEETVPLRMWKEGGNLGAVFCDRCASECFGIKFHDLPFGDQ